jgi:hypothetical protein
MRRVIMYLKSECNYVYVCKLVYLCMYYLFAVVEFEPLIKKLIFISPICLSYFSYFLCLSERA